LLHGWDGMGWDGGVCCGVGGQFEVITIVVEVKY